MTLSQIAVAGLLGVSATLAQAVAIPGLVNTGAGLSNGFLDTNYAFVAVLGDATGTACASVTGKCGAVASNDLIFPLLSNWIPDSNSTLSHWLTPSTDQGQSYDQNTPGQYTWTLKFNLTGFDPTTASLSGRFATDNNSVASLNTNGLLNPSTAFSTWSTFSAGAGSFVNGINTLTFTVNNLAGGQNPTGLRVEFTSSSVTAVPEPETYAMFLAGLGVVGFVAARRRPS